MCLWGTGGYGVFSKDDGHCFLDSIRSKGKLLEALSNEDTVFTKEELTEIIHSQFFDDAQTLDLDLVDTVLIRMMLIDGIK